MAYAIQLSSTKKVFTPSNRYILWVDDNWYETARQPMYLFEEKDLEKIQQQLKSHFIFNAKFIKDGVGSTMWSFFSKIKPKFEVKGLSFKIKL